MGSGVVCELLAESLDYLGSRFKLPVGSITLPHCRQRYQDNLLGRVTSDPPRRVRLFANMRPVTSEGEGRRADRRYALLVIWKPERHQIRRRGEARRRRTEKE